MNPFSRWVLRLVPLRSRLDTELSIVSGLLDEYCGSRNNPVLARLMNSIELDRSDRCSSLSRGLPSRFKYFRFVKTLKASLWIVEITFLHKKSFSREPRPVISLKKMLRMLLSSKCSSVRFGALNSMRLDRNFGNQGNRFWS